MNEIPSESDLKQLAALLRRPEGEQASEVVQRMNEGNRLINEAAINVMRPVTGTILEIGMANGIMTPAILARNPAARYIGCDISLQMVNAALERNREHVDAGRAEFVHVEAGSLPADLDADSVLSVNTIYFWEDAPAFLGLIHSTLRPGGQLVLAFRPENTMKELPFVKYGFNSFRSEDADSLLSDAGFAVDRIVEDQEPDRYLFGKNVRVDHVVVSATRP